MTAIGTDRKVLIDVESCEKRFPVFGGTIFRRVIGHVSAVDAVSLQIREGETYALVGESGCGKTTLARMILQVQAPTGGTIRFNGEELSGMTGGQRATFHGAVQAVFQDPWSSLNPRMRVGSIILEPLLVDRRVAVSEAKERLRVLLKDVGLNASCAERYPHEFSGGQRQRIAIARALSSSPSLIVLDEPVSSLDVSIRAQIMNLLRRVQERLGVSYLLISHNLATVRYMSHRVGVMYLGRIVEEAPTRELFSNPAHPYTRTLIAASLPSHPDRRNQGEVVLGEVPSPLNPPSGCRFHPRCPIAVDRCSREAPPLKRMSLQHQAACHLAHSNLN